MFTILLMLLAGNPLSAQDLQFKALWPGLKFKQPVAVVADPSHAGPLYVVEQAGRIWKVEGGQRSLYLDVSPRVSLAGPEEGLLCLAFHPAQKARGRAYIIYSVKDSKPLRTRLSEIRSGKERVLFEVEKPFSNHNGSTLAFGPDGYLYISLGDGGGAGDPHGNAQDLGSLLGKVLRIDVDHRTGDLPYAIPKDNPFVADPKARGEVWAYGLRNTWRMAFDPLTGALWGGDVGQNAYEEVDIIIKGGNYGWNRREGTHRYKKGKGDFIEPVIDYGRSDGVSVTGGMVVRGQGPQALLGRYVYADFGLRNIWSIDAGRPGRGSLKLHGQTPESPSSFGTDAAGQLLMVGYEGTIFSVE